MRTLFLLLALMAGTALAVENHPDEVVAEVLANVAKLKAAKPDAVPIALWDFDGTIMEGDISEGLEEGKIPGRKPFSGLLEDAMLAGMSTVYKGEQGWKQYHDIDYPRMNQIGRWLAWPYNAQIFRGVCEQEILTFCERKVKEKFSHHFFASSVKIMKQLEKAGVENFVISGSPEVFVKSTAKALGLPVERFRGIRVAVDGGRMTTRLIYPLSYGPGKVENLRELVLSRPNGVAVAGFGNSYSTDGNFMRYIVTQHLPGGAKGYALMVNGGEEPEEFRGLFRCVRQSEVVGD